MFGRISRGLYRSIGVMALLIVVLFYQTHDLSAREGILISSVAEEYANGLHSRILQAIARNLRMELVMKYTSFARRLVFLDEGKIDICIGIYKTPEREKYIHFIQPPYRINSNKYFFVLKENKSLLQKYEDLYHLDIGTSINSLYFERFDNDRKLSKVKVKTTEQRFRMLLLNRIDVVINSYLGGQAIVNKLGIDDKVEIADYYHSETRSVHVGVSRKSPLIKKLNVIEPAIKKMINDGEITRISDDYYARILTGKSLLDKPADHAAGYIKDE